MNQEKIGKFISQCRKEQKLTQEQLANKLNITHKAVSKWETGRGMPDYSKLKDLCSILEIDVDEFLAGEKIKEKRHEQTIENLDSILREYYKMKKQKNIIKNILIVILILYVLFIIKGFMVFGIASLSFSIPEKKISGIENYDKNYYIKEYRGDLDSNLSIFPDNKLNMKDAYFSSSFQKNLFDIDGYILLKSKYNKENFDGEIDRLKNLSMTIYDSCKDDANNYTNYVRYDEKSYKYPSYITIDGFRDTYEYALINEDNLEIIYVYLSYPKIDKIEYENYLKKDLSLYSITTDTLDMYTMYNHSFDNGKSYIGFDVCN